MGTDEALTATQGASQEPTSGEPPSTGTAEPSAETAPALYTKVGPAIDSVFERLGFKRPGRWFWILALAVLVDLLVLSWTQVRAYQSYYTFSQDFGSFNQSFYTTLYDHRLFYYTANLPSGTQGTYFAVHFAPLLFLILPFYALAPAPTTLLVIKVVVLGLAAFPVFGIAHRRLGSPQWGFAFGIAYLLSPLTMTLDWISFDMEVFLPLFVLSALYFLTAKRRLAFLLCWVLALAVIETIAPLLALCAFLALLGTTIGPRLVPDKDRREERTFWIGALFLALGWYLVAYFAVSHFSLNGGTFGSGYASHYTVLGATSFFDVIPQALLHPDLAGAALSYAGSTKVVYVLLLFGCLAFLPLFGEARYSLPVVGWLGLALFSNFPPMYSLGSQYLGYVSPFLFAGAIGGTRYLRSLITRELSSTGPYVHASSVPTKRWTLPAPEQALLPISLGIAVVVALAVANPLSGQPAAGLTSLQYGVPTPDSHALLLDRTIGLIPSNASVLTTAHVFPQVSNRLHAYVLPTTQLFAGSSTYWGYLNQFINSSSFVLLDFTLDLYVSQLILYFGNFSHFGIVVDSDGVFLLQRGWTNAPLSGFYSGSSSTYSGASLATNSRLEAQGNGTLYYHSSGTPNLNFWRGPSLNYVLPGTYDLTVNFRFVATTNAPLFSFRLLWTAVDVDAVQSMNSSVGHHFDYVFNRQPAVSVEEVNFTAAPGTLHAWTFGNASLRIPVTGLGSIGTLGVTLTGVYSIYVSDVTIIQVGAPPYLGNDV